MFILSLQIWHYRICTLLLFTLSIRGIAKKSFNNPLSTFTKPLNIENQFAPTWCTFCAATWGHHMSVKQNHNVGNSITHWGLLSPAVSETLQTPAPAAKSTRPNTSFRQPASGTTFSVEYCLSDSFFKCYPVYISTIKNTFNMQNL